MQLAQTLIEKERLGKEVKDATVSQPILHKTPSPRTHKTPESRQNPCWTLQSVEAEQTSSEKKAEAILCHTQILREEIQKAKDEIAKRKARFDRRRTEFASAKEELLQSQAVGTEPVERSIWRTRQRWDLMHVKTTESRFLLCKEAAKLYGLHRQKRTKGSLGKDVYYIGGVTIPNLRDLNNAPPLQVTTALNHLAHLTHLVSHYLSLRLPAEIILPHRDYPFPVINPPSSSYIGRDVSSRGSNPPQPSDDSSLTSRSGEQRSLPKPRPLQLDKQLSSLAKDDPIAYASFIEGVTFVAWDVAWLSRTQGGAVGEKSWEEVCDIGGNMHQLLHLPPPARPPPSKEWSSRDYSQKPPSHPLKTVSVANGQEPAKGASSPNHFSHGIAYSFLAAAAGAEHIRTWRLQSPIRIIEKVKAMLLAERTGAEWEILEGKEWEVEDDEFEAKGNLNLVSGTRIEDTGILVKPETEEGERRGKSTSGWTKLKNR